MKFMLRRAFHGLFLLFGVSLLSFFLLQMAPGNFFDEMKLNPQISPATIAHLRSQYAMDRPLPLRYAHWLASVGHGEFGYSFAYNTPVAPLVLARARNTLLLAGTGTLFAWAIALLIGVPSATRQGRWGDRVLSGSTAALVSLPDVLIALALLLLAVRSGILPAGGMSSVNADEMNTGQHLLDVLKHMVLPVAALTLSLLPTLIRHVRSAVAEGLSMPFMRATRAHGIGRQRMLWRHCLPAAANPLISLFGISVATMLSASLLIEIIMSWPGMGPLLLEAILARDVYVVIGTVLFSSVLLLAGNLLSDVLLVAVDPRIRRP
jgi:peptide/nickel transport system permease protein